MGEQRTALILLMILASSILSMFVLAVPFIQISEAEQVDPTTYDFVVGFLSDVVELDLTKYNITNEGYGATYPPEYGGGVKEEVISFELVSDEDDIHVMGILVNESGWGINIYATHGSILFKHQPSTSALDESKNILQRYQAFAENYGFDTSHVLVASTLLNSAVEESSTSGADFHTFNNLTGFVPSVISGDNMKQETTETGVRWIYTENGVDMPNICLSLDFGTNQLHFSDTWNLFSVGSFSVISEDEAKSIAWDAAQSYNVTLVGENDTLVHVDPEWSNRSSVELRMIPGQIHNMDAEVNDVDAGNATRDPLALYPMWHFAFAFDHSYGGCDGVQVGVWGDTAEIAYISEYGHLDGSIPEFPSSLILPLFLIATLSVIFVRKSLKSKVAS